MPVPAWPVFVSGNEHVARKPCRCGVFVGLPSPTPRVNGLAPVVRRTADVVEEDALRVPVRPQHVEVQRVERVHVLVLAARVRAGVERRVVQLPRVAADDRHRRSVRPVEVDHPDVLRVRVDHPDRRQAAGRGSSTGARRGRGRTSRSRPGRRPRRGSGVGRAGPVRAVEERRLEALVRARAREVAAAARFTVRPTKSPAGHRLTRLDRARPRCPGSGSVSRSSVTWSDGVEHPEPVLVLEHVVRPERRTRPGSGSATGCGCRRGR